MNAIVHGIVFASLEGMKHILPALPYSKNALEPHISAETMDFHHDKHHRAYVEKLNQLIEGTKFENMTLEEIVTSSGEGPIYNNAAQVWNHTFLWSCLTPKFREPQGPLLDQIRETFGSFETFKDQFIHAGVELFGSGYVWLTFDRKSQKLAIEKSGNAGNPLRSGKVPLLTCDVWEHAYYIDYRNAREKFLQSFWSVAHWEFVERNFAACWQVAAA